MMVWQLAGAGDPRLAWTQFIPVYPRSHENGIWLWQSVTTTFYASLDVVSVH